MAGPERLWHFRIEVNVESSELASLQTSMQHPIRTRLRFGQLRLSASTWWEEMVDAHEQAQCVEIGQVACRLIPLRNKFLGMIGWPQPRLQFGVSIIVKTEVGRAELLFKDRHPGEQRH